MILPWQADLPPDAVLLSEGFMRPVPDRPAATRAMLLACGALARDAVATVAAMGWGHVDIEALPARLHARPDRIPAALRARARVAQARGYARVAALFGDCGSDGAIASVCAEESIAMLRVPHCAALYAPETADAGGSALVLTDFLLRHFDAMVWQPMQLERHPELVDVLFAAHERILHVAQRPDDGLDRLAIRLAVRLARPVERMDGPADALAAPLAALVGP